MTKLSFLFCFFLLPSLALAAQNSFPPVDEAGQNAEFLAFRTNLIRIVKEQDEKALLKIVHPDIEYSFGDGPGIGGFSRQWRLNRGENSAIWKEILAVLELGGGFNAEGEFVAPYVAAKWPKGKDPFEYDAVIAKEAHVRARPEEKARSVAKVGYEIVKLREADAPEGWIAVLALNGKKGFLPAASLRSPLDYRGYFKKVEGEWRMSAFLAGD